MKRNLVIFVVTFIAGAIVAFVARAALHDPHEHAPAHPAADSAPEPMVRNALIPAAAPPTSPPARGTVDHSVHAPAAGVPAATATSDQHDHGAQAGAATATKTVNSRCAICGMPVDPNLPTLEFRGQTIGFGCKMCAPKFKADPEKYGPLYLRNEVIKR